MVGGSGKWVQACGTSMLVSFGYKCRVKTSVVYWYMLSSYLEFRRLVVGLLQSLYTNRHIFQHVISPANKKKLLRRT